MEIITPPVSQDTPQHSEARPIHAYKKKTGVDATPQIKNNQHTNNEELEI
jgi:hypothetical protein